MKTETQTDLLTEADAERLEKRGFGVDRFGEIPVRVGRKWRIGDKIDAALIGVLTEMCRELIGIMFRPDVRAYPVHREALNELTIFANATPREIFDALLDALEASE